MADESLDKAMAEQLALHDKRLSVVETRVELMQSTLDDVKKHAERQANALQQLAIAAGRLEQRFTTGQWWIMAGLTMLTIAVGAVGVLIAAHGGAGL